MVETQIREASQTERSAIAAFYARCGYAGGLELEDTVLAALRDGSLVGAVRLCFGHGEVVLRGMQVAPELRRQGIGSALLEACLPRMGTATCYCIPWANLEKFYVSGGFERCRPAEAPAFLSERLSAYRASGRDVILMRRPPKK